MLVIHDWMRFHSRLEVSEISTRLADTKWPRRTALSFWFAARQARRLQARSPAGSKRAPFEFCEFFVFVLHSRECAAYRTAKFKITRAGEH
jgi:hypothetical protein